MPETIYDYVVDNFCFIYFRGSNIHFKLSDFKVQVLKFSKDLGCWHIQCIPKLKFLVIYTTLVDNFFIWNHLEVQIFVLNFSNFDFFLFLNDLWCWCGLDQSCSFFDTWSIICSWYIYLRSFKDSKHFFDVPHSLCVVYCLLWSGYMAPECTSGRKFLLSIKSDVYSYGVLVLEIITGHKIYTFEGQDSEGLVEYVSSAETLLAYPFLAWFIS